MASSGASLAHLALLAPAHPARGRRAAWATAPIDPIPHPAPSARSSARVALHHTRVHTRVEHDAQATKPLQLHSEGGSSN